MNLREELSSKSNLRHAWEHVATKGGAAGIDRVTIAEFGARLDPNLEELRQEIHSNRYRSLPVVRIRPPFLTTSDRALVVPTVRDRVVQRAIADLLAPHIEPTLSAACRAFRKGHSARSAADDVGRWTENGLPWVLRADVRSFFDNIRPELVRQMLEPFVDEDGLRLLDRIVRCRIFDHDQVSEMVVGISQGSPLSPLLSNLYLRDVDKALLAEYPHYLRYCDDMITLGSEESHVREAFEQLIGAIAPLGLSLNAEKTRICRAEDGFVFLGYHFGATGRGPAVKAVKALEFRLAELAAAAQPDVAEIDAVYRGWTGYFGHHPECWMSSPAGILVLLRAADLPDPETIRRRLAEARWKLPVEPTPELAIELGKAWSAAGHEEQSWLELATACGGSRAEMPQVGKWAQLLRVEPQTLSQLAGRLVGPPADRLAALTEAVAELGRYAVATRLAAAVSSYTAAPDEDAISAVSADLAADADPQLLSEWFRGRDGVHAIESVNRAGHRSFVPVHRPILADDWTAHLAGDRTLALPLVRTGDTAFIGVLDVDIERRFLEERFGVPDELLGRALVTALRLRRELQQRGCASLLELSGHKGYHLWIRLEDPLPCFRLRRWLLDVVGAIGALPEGIRVEEFPNRDRVKPDAVGPLIKLPLGIHSRTGKRCALLDDRGEVLADPMDAIRSLPRVAARVISEQPDSSDKQEATETAAVKAAEIGPRARRILEGCHVLSYLAKKAREASYLTHLERSTLLYTLGHLGDEGTAALHAIMAHTYNYRRELTARHLERLPPWPISCPKIRELHPGAMDSGTCKCHFALRGKGYPTPLLFALRPSEVPVFRRQAPKPKGSQATTDAAAPAAPAVGNAQAVSREAEETIRKLAELKRHRRGIDASIERLRQELAALFERAESDTLQLSIGLLRRVKRTDDEGWDFVIEV